MTVSSWVLEHVAASGLAINTLAVGVGIFIGIWMYRRWGERWANERRFRISLTISHGVVNIGLIYLSFVLMESHKRFTAFIAMALVMMTIAAFITLKELHRRHQKNNKQPDPGYGT